MDIRGFQGFRSINERVKSRVKGLGIIERVEYRIELIDEDIGRIFRVGSRVVNIQSG